MVTKSTKPGHTSPGIRAPRASDYVVAELRYNSGIGFSAAGFEGPAAASKSIAGLTKILEGVGVRSVSSHFDMPERRVRERVELAPASMPKKVSADFAQSGFVRLVPKRKRDVSELAKRLNRSASVWKAFAAPTPVPAGEPTGTSSESRCFEVCQGYLASAPDGIAAIDAWTKFGARGKSIWVCDIEGDWNFTHEDLPKVTHLGGDLQGDGWKDHGTAVLGEIVGKPGRSGVVGISHAARPYVHSAVINGLWNTAGAIMAATKKLRAGDVILIELQGTGPNGKYVAMQYWDDVFSAIRVATAKGITVVEAAGNGNEDFELPIFNNTGLQKDSGAVIVGAGVPPTNVFGNYGSDWGFGDYEAIGTPRSRIWFSNHGKIVNVQGWGWHVSTCGYGDAQGGKDENRWYTHRFSGTSSASPIVTGAVACLQGHARVNNGSPLSPAKVRSILMKSGTLQAAGPGVPLSQRIGPLPNLTKALVMV